MRLDESLYDWVKQMFAEELPEDIMDGENLYRIESKLREYGKALQGEHVRYMYLCPQERVQRPEGVILELYEGEEVIVKRGGISSRLVWILRTRVTSR